MRVFITFVERRHHHQVGLGIGAEQEYVFPGVGETTFRIEGAGAIVSLPHAQPQGPGAPVARLGLHALHQRLRDTPAVPLVTDVKTPQLDRTRPGHAVGHVIAAHLRISDRRAALLDQQRRDVTVEQLARLYDPHRTAWARCSAMSAGSLVARKGVVEGAARQVRDHGGVGGGGDANRHRPIVTLRLRSGEALRGTSGTFTA